MRVRFALAVFALLATTLPLRAAVFSNLVEYGKVTNSSQAFRTLSGQRDMTPIDHVKIGILGDEALSVLKLVGSEGMMVLNSHACSGPPPGANAGHAEATGQLYYEESFLVQSATLAVGTPVTINVSISAGSAFVASTTNPNNLPTLDTASVGGSASVRIDSNLLGEVNLTGNFSGGQQGGFDDIRNQSGLFATVINFPTEQGDRRSGEFNVTVGGKVGQAFNIAVRAALSAVSNAGYTSVSDADGQISILWGAEVEGGLAEIISLGDEENPGMLIPPPSNATAERALIYLPIGVRGVPEPGSAGLLGAALAFGLLIRRSRRSLNQL